MPLIECDWRDNDPYLAEIRRIEDESMKRYWDEQHQYRQTDVNGLVTIPTRDCFPGGNHATGVLIFHPDNFKTVLVSFEPANVIVDNYIQGASALTATSEIKNRPRIGLLQKDSKPVSLEVLTKGLWDYDDRTRARSQFSTCKDVWNYAPKIAEYESPQYLMCYAKRSDDGRVGWTYFPVKSEEINVLRELFK